MKTIDQEIDEILDEVEEFTAADPDVIPVCIECGLPILDNGRCDGCGLVHNG